MLTKIITLGILGTAILGFGLLNSFGGPPAHLKIPELNKILQSKETDWPVEVLDAEGKSTGEFENRGKIMKYDYITDKEVQGKFMWLKGEFTNKKILNENGNERTVACYPGDQFYKDESGKVYEIQHGATTTIEVWNAEWKKQAGLIPKAFALSTTTYTAAGDGYVGYFNATTWAIAHDAAEGIAAAAANPSNALYVKKDAPNNWDLMKHFYPMNTDFGEVVTVTGAVMNLYWELAAGNLDDDGVDMVISTSTQASNTTLATTDYNKAGSTNGGELALASWTSGQYNQITLTDTSWVITDGWTKLSLRMSIDIENIAPSDINSLNEICFVEHATASRRPYLAITYTLPVAAAPQQQNATIFEY